MPVSSCRGALVALLTAPAVAACGSVVETMIERSHPPAHAAGYADGCASGKEAAGGLFADARKHASRYGADDQYPEGWDVGFEECRRDMAAWCWTPACATPAGTIEADLAGSSRACTRDIGRPAPDRRA